MRRARNASTWRESIYRSNVNNGIPANGVSSASSKRVSFAVLPGNDNGDVHGSSSQPDDDANNDNNRLPHVKEEEMLELAPPTETETARPARYFTASELRLEQALSEDIYSLMYTAPFCSTAFAFSCVSFGLQFIILFMICKRHYNM
jgi:hypothetical protein